MADAGVERVITLALETTGIDATRWSTRSTGKRSGFGKSAISRFRRGLEPHRAKTLKLTEDPPAMQVGFPPIRQLCC